MANAEAPAMDPALFRNVMSRFATGVTVITTQARGDVRGMTANAFMSGSLDPPLCVVSVATTARMHALLVAAGHFGVSILTEAQQRLCAHFAGRPDADLKPAFEYIGQTPVLADAAAAITANIVASHACGDHSIFIGRIVDLRARGGTPLVVHGGRYAALLYLEEPAGAPIADFW